MLKDGLIPTRTQKKRSVMGINYLKVVNYFSTTFNYSWQNKKRERHMHYNSPAKIIQKCFKRYADEQVMW